MNIFKRGENRDAWKKTPENIEQATEGSVVTKHILGIAEADRGEIKWGRRKNLLRTGYVGLLALKAATEFTTWARDVLEDRFDFVPPSEDIPQIEGRWFMPTLVGLYAASRISRRRQNSRHELAMQRREVFRAQYGPSTESGDFATGAINTLGNRYEMRTVLGILDRPDNNADGSRQYTMEDFLHHSQPTIPESLPAPTDQKV